MIIVIIGGVAGISMLINFTCNVKLWEIAITLEDSSNISKDLDGSVVFMKPLPPPWWTSAQASLQQLLLHPHHSAEVTGSVSLSYLQALTALLFVKGFPQAEPKRRRLTVTEMKVVPNAQIRNLARVKSKDML